MIAQMPVTVIQGQLTIGLFSFRKSLATGRSLLWKRDRDCFFVSAYFWRETSHKMNDHFSAAVCKLHVQAIGPRFWCHHANTPLKENMQERLPRGTSADTTPLDDCTSLS